MSNSCCVPGCTSNYYKDEYVPVFLFPSDEGRRKLCLRKIPRENLKVTKNTGVCILHFPKEKIIREIRATRPDGSVLVLPRKKLELENDTVPSIFPKLPTYLTTTAAPPRKGPQQRRTAHVELEMQKYSEWLLEDNFNTFDDIFRLLNCSNPKTLLIALKKDILETGYSGVNCECGKSLIDISETV